MILVESFVRVRYAETDQMGYVYYGNYPQFFEIGRVELFRSIGLSYKELEEVGVMMPVADLSVKYVKPGRYDDLLKIVTKLEVLPGVKIVFNYEIFNEKEELITEGKTTLFFMDKHTQKVIKCPQKLLDLVTPFFE